MNSGCAFDAKTDGDAFTSFLAATSVELMELCFCHQHLALGARGWDTALLSNY